MRGGLAQQMISLSCLKAAEANASLTLQSSCDNDHLQAGTRLAADGRKKDIFCARTHIYFTCTYSSVQTLNLASRLGLLGREGFSPLGN